MAAIFFADSDFQSQLKQLHAKLLTVSDPNLQDKVTYLRSVLRLMTANGAEWDRHCQVNIAWIGDQFRSRVSDMLENDFAGVQLDKLYAFLYRFVAELEITVNGELSYELRVFVNFVKEKPSSFEPGIQSELEFVSRDMPLAILKYLLGSETIQNLRNIEKYSGDITKKYADWDTELNDREERVGVLKDALNTYKTAFNFVGLFHGFDELAEVKRKEIEFQRRWLVFFGVLATLPIASEMLALAVLHANLESVKLLILMSALPVFSLTLIFIYFFRVALRNSEAASSITADRASKNLVSIYSKLCRICKRPEGKQRGVVGKVRECYLFGNSF